MLMAMNATQMDCKRFFKSSVNFDVVCLSETFFRYKVQVFQII